MIEPVKLTYKAVRAGEISARSSSDLLRTIYQMKQHTFDRLKQKMVAKKVEFGVDKQS